MHFGEQIAVDPPFHLHTSFIKTTGGEHGGHWTARINVTATVSNFSYLYFFSIYLHIEGLVEGPIYHALFILQNFYIAIE